MLGSARGTVIMSDLRTGGRGDGVDAGQVGLSLDAVGDEEGEV